MLHFRSTHLSHTLGSGFHYTMYIGISRYRTLTVVWTEIYGSYVMCDLIVRENTAHVPRIKCSPNLRKHVKWHCEVTYMKSLITSARNRQIRRLHASYLQYPHSLEPYSIWDVSVYVDIGPDCPLNDNHRQF